MGAAMSVSHPPHGGTPKGLLSLDNVSRQRQLSRHGLAHRHLNALGALGAVVACAAILRTARAVPGVRRWLGVFLRRCGRTTSEINDPTFGPSLGIVYDRGSLANSWEVFLDAVGLPSTSPMRQHARQLTQRPELDGQLRKLFAALSGENSRLTAEDVVVFSTGLQGGVRVLLNTSRREPLMRITLEDKHWLLEHFDKSFPAETPLDCEAFLGFARLIIIRRIVRTLIKIFGLERLRNGLSEPLVVDVYVALQNGSVPFRWHTVTPVASPQCGGERLGLIEEHSPKSSAIE